MGTENILSRIMKIAVGGTTKHQAVAARLQYPCQVPIMTTTIDINWDRKIVMD
jgi:hypothetical protein